MNYIIRLRKKKRILAKQEKVRYNRFGRNQVRPRAILRTVSKSNGAFQTGEPKKMTERLYYEDSYLLEFDGKVTQVRQEQGCWVALDRSAFYPTSGGQPYDTGALIWKNGKTAVTDVQVDKSGVVWHRVEDPVLPGTEVHGSIDAERRKDHMEQHAGEHLLAGAIWEKLGGTTIGLHLGSEESSIDVTMPDGRTHLSDEEIEMLERLENSRIRADAPIRCWFPNEEELNALPLRKKPAVEEHIRVVSMGDFEMVACGGTHPSSTGQIGQIKIISNVPSRGKIRISFLCGERAENYFRILQQCARKVGNVLSCPMDRLASCAGELKAKLADAERRLNRFETERILDFIHVNEETDSLPGVTLSVTVLEEMNSKAVSAAVTEYISEKGKALLLCVGERLTFARSSDVNIDMNELIRRVGRGGGRPDLSSGAGIPQCVQVARKILMTEGKDKKWRLK